MRISEQDYLEAVDSDTGWCDNCQEFTNSMVEPDAEGYTCDDCGMPTVCGAEQALILGKIRF